MRLCSAIDRYLVNLARHRIGQSFEAVLFQQFHCVINQSILVSLHRTNLQKQRYTTRNVLHELRPIRQEPKLTDLFFSTFLGEFTTRNWWELINYGAKVRTQRNRNTVSFVGER